MNKDIKEILNRLLRQVIIGVVLLILGGIISILFTSPGTQVITREILYYLFILFVIIFIPFLFTLLLVIFKK